MNKSRDKRRSNKYEIMDAHVLGVTRLSKLNKDMHPIFINKIRMNDIMSYLHEIIE